MTIDLIPFNRPYATGKELVYQAEAQRHSHLSGDGLFTKRCHQWIEQRAGCAKALLTHSCTSALDMAALLLDIERGDEVIMPSYTFVSTANAFVLRGAVPVFVDIREDTLNLDERLIEAAITPRTRAIAPVHYAGASSVGASPVDASSAAARRKPSATTYISAESCRLAAGFACLTVAKSRFSGSSSDFSLPPWNTLATKAPPGASTVAAKS